MPRRFITLVTAGPDRFDVMHALRFDASSNPWTAPYRRPVPQPATERRPA